MSSMCCAVLYIHISVYILLFLAKATWLLLPACKVWTFLWPIFFCCFFVFASFFRSVGLFSGKSLNAPSPVEKEKHRHRQRLDIYATPSTTWTRTRRAEVAEQQQQAAGSRQHATGWGSCQILVLVSGCGATCCPGCVHECVWGVCVCCDQHCWSTHSHTHTHTPVQTLPGCVVIFSFSLPCCCLPLPALVIIVFAFFSSFFLFLVNLLSTRLPCCCCCWLSSLVRNVIKFLLVQQHSTLFSSP